MSYPNNQGNPAGAIPVYFGGGPGSSGAPPYRYTPLGYQQLTSLASSTGLTVPAGATVAFVTVSIAGVRYRDDATAPTAAVGMPVGVGSQLVYSGSLATIRFIQQTAGAVLDVSYYS